MPVSKYAKEKLSNIETHGRTQHANGDLRKRVVAEIKFACHELVAQTFLRPMPTHRSGTSGLFHRNSVTTTDRGVFCNPSRTNVWATFCVTLNTQIFPNGTNAKYVA